MLLYHYSVTYRSGPSLLPDYQKNAEKAEPWRQALTQGWEKFDAMLEKYRQQALLARAQGRHLEYAKYALEALFELVRQREFSEASVSRLHCVYFCDCLESAVKAAYADWISCGGAAKEEVKLLEVEVEESQVYTYDQVFFDRAYEKMERHQARDCVVLARQYFAGERSETPFCEILSGGENRILREVEY